MRGSVARPERGNRYRFGVFECDADTLELCRSGRALHVRPQSLRLLTLLVARAGEMVSRADIQHALWGADTFIDFEQGVNHCIKELRAALGDSAESPRYIETLPRRGYRFIAPVETIRWTEPSSTLAITPRDPAEPVVAHEPAAGGAASASERRGRRRLHRSWLYAASLATVAAAIAILSYQARPGSRTLGPSTIVVQPFTTSSADPTLAIGLANAISGRLGRQRLVPVRPAGGPADRARIPLSNGEGAAIETVPVLLDGEIRASGTDLAVLARLKASGGAVLWSETFRVRADELFSVEDVIAERVVAALNLRVAAAEQDGIRRRYTSNHAAYEEYLRGRAALVQYTPDGTLRAIRAFEAALQQDPRYALARAGLAMASADMYLRFAPAGDAEDWGARAEAEARAALELDSDLAEAHLAQAAVARKREFDWNAVITASRRALALNPNLDQGRFFLAAAYYHLGYMEEALIEMEKGRALHGADLIEAARIKGLVALFSGQFVPARVHLAEVSRLSSEAIGDTYLGLAEYYTGSIARGRALLEPLARHASPSTAARSAAALAGILAAHGEAAAARRHIDVILEGDYRDHHVAYGLGVAYAQLGNGEEAVRWLRTAADTGFLCLPWFERDSLLEPLRRRTEFADLLAYVRSRRESSRLSVN